MITITPFSGLPRHRKQYLSLFKQGSKTVSERKEFLEQYKEHIDQQIRVFQTTRLLLEKKIEYYKNIETSLAEGETSVSDNCSDYFNEWEDFKKILEETIYE